VTSAAPAARGLAGAHMRQKLVGAGVPGVFEGILAATAGIDLQSIERRLGQILAEPASHPVQDDIDRALHGKRRHRDPAGECLDDNESEGIGPAREHKYIRARDMLGEIDTRLIAGKADRRVAALQHLEIRPAPDNVFGTRQVEPQEGFNILFDRHPSHVQENRTGTVEE